MKKIKLTSIFYLDIMKPFQSCLYIISELNKGKPKQQSKYFYMVFGLFFFISETDKELSNYKSTTL